LLPARQTGICEEYSDQRGARRRKLRLEAQASSSAQQSHVILLHDLSQGGLLIETDADLRLGEIIGVSLSADQSRDARVVWNSGNLFGCTFSPPLPAAWVSAALLRSEPRPGASDHQQGPKSWQQEPGFSRRTKALIAIGGVLISWLLVGASIAVFLD
jgi:hypothetical protein